MWEIKYYTSKILQVRNPWFSCILWIYHVYISYVCISQSKIHFIKNYVYFLKRKFYFIAHFCFQILKYHNNEEILVTKFKNLGWSRLCQDTGYKSKPPAVSRPVNETFVLKEFKFCQDVCILMKRYNKRRAGMVQLLKGPILDLSWGCEFKPLLGLHHGYGAYIKKIIIINNTNNNKKIIIMKRHNGYK